MQCINIKPQRIELDWLDRMKAALDKQDRLLKGFFDDPRIAEQDRLNSLPCPEPEDDATGSAK